ncbi:MAG: hypothetical protein K2Y29_15500 [Beijerinckiaceae bacterium]|nr:hypothetical protein [Beijerinckiaceae bacterium]
MQLIETLGEASGGLRAQIYEMAASGFTVFIYEEGRETEREGFVFDTEADAHTFAQRRVTGETTS